MNKAIDIRKTAVGQKIVFTSGYAMVNRDGFELDGMEGEVVKKNPDAIFVKLDKHYPILDEWDNCLIFDTDAYFIGTEDNLIKCAVKQ